MIRVASEETTVEDERERESSHRSVPRVTLLHPRCFSHAITTRETTIGRSASRDIALEGDRVSRMHARIRSEGGRVFLTDAGSRNGTFVNGKQIQRAELGVGDVVRFGSWVGTFVRDDPSSERPVLRVDSNMFAGPVFQRVLERASLVAESNLPLMLIGDSGSGKELLAKFIHERSGRRGPFVAVNCAAVPETLAESQLFGHRRGAYTGADREQLGAIRRAHQGTLFLDEIGDLPLAIQAKLLRVLEDFEVTPLGDAESHSVDVRVVVAGHRSLKCSVQAKSFRGDLYARLNGLELAVPPLRERKEEILALFLDTFEASTKRPAPKVSPEFAEALLLYRWPYNGRELVLMARRLAVLHGTKQMLTTKELPPEISDGLQIVEASEKGPVSLNGELVDKLHDALQRHDGNVTRAAEAMGISRGRAYRLMTVAKASRGA